MTTTTTKSDDELMTLREDVERFMDDMQEQLDALKDDFHRIKRNDQLKQDFEVVAEALLIEIQSGARTPVGARDVLRTHGYWVPMT
jgi:hypothetical protein